MKTKLCVIALLCMCGCGITNTESEDNSDLKGYYQKRLPNNAEIISIEKRERDIGFTYWVTFKVDNDCFFMRGEGYTSVMANITCPQKENHD